MNLTSIKFLVCGTTFVMASADSVTVHASEEFPEISWEAIDRIIGYQKGQRLSPREVSMDLKRQFQAYYELRIRGNERMIEIEEYARRMANLGVRMSQQEIDDKINVSDSLVRLDQLMSNTLDRIKDEDYVASWRSKAMELRGYGGIRPGTTRASGWIQPTEQDFLAAAKVAGIDMPAVASERPSLLNTTERDFESSGKYSFAEIAAMGREFRVNSCELKVPPTPTEFWRLHDEIKRNPHIKVDPIASRLLVAIILTAEADREVKSTPKSKRAPNELLRFFHKTRRLAWAFEDIDGSMKATKVKQEKANQVIAALKAIRARYGAF